MAPWFDTHVHLDRYPVVERDGLVTRATSAGVAMIAVAVDLESAVEVLALPPGAVAGSVIGIHPARARRWFANSLMHVAEEPGVVGIGECGFDDSGPDFETQRWAFGAQCEVARATNLALVLHIDGERAWQQLTEHGGALDGSRVLRHYFTGDAAQAAWHRERGHYLSFGNPLRRDPGLRDIARDYPAELLLIETDSYPLPGRTTEPKDVIEVGRALAEIRGWSIDEAREQLARNTSVALGIRETASGYLSQGFSTP